MRRALIVVGPVLMAYAVVGALVDHVKVFGVLLFLVAVLAVHDGIFLPVVLGVSALAGRVVPGAFKGPGRAAAIVSISVSVVAVPLVLRYGRPADNPSVLPRAYGAGLFVVLALVALWWLAHRLVARRDAAQQVAALAGLAAGAVVAAVEWTQDSMSTATADLTPGPAVTAVVTVVGGGIIGSVLRYRPGRLSSLITTGVLIGLLWWAIEWLTVLPLLAGHRVTWSLDDAQASFGFLAGALIQSALAAGLVAVSTSRLPAPASRVPRSPDQPRSRIVVVGGGFGGVAVAQRLERRLTGRPDTEVVLISNSNYQLFSPMLAGVAGGTLSPQHIGAPLRAALRDTRFRHAALESVDAERREVIIRSDAGAPVALRYDHLVLALGSVPDYRNVPGLDRHAFTLKSLTDASRLREHVIAQLERADSEPPGAERLRRLTVVVAGGGFAGTELIAELRDLVHAVRRYFPRLDPEDLRFVLLHSQDRLLPELDEQLAEHALRRLRAKGVEVRLGTRLVRVEPDEVALDDGTVVPTTTLVWTAGNAANPLVHRLGFEIAFGAVACESTMQVRGHDRVWALGDCAAVPDLTRPGRTVPPTAQHALRAGVAVADNIVAALDGRTARPFRFRTIALLVALGHQDGVAQIGRRLLSGRVAWVLWRGVYLSKLPGLENRIRVSIDWLLDLFFPRDVVLTQPAAAESPAMAVSEEAR